MFPTYSVKDVRETIMHIASRAADEDKRILIARTRLYASEIAQALNENETPVHMHYQIIARLIHYINFECNANTGMRLNNEVRREISYRNELGI